MAKKIKPCDPCASPNWYRKKQKSRYQRDKRHQEQESAYFDKIFKQECDMVAQPMVIPLAWWNLKWGEKA